MGRPSFSQAMDQLINVRWFAEDIEFDTVTLLENVILDHLPTSLTEVMTMLDVVIPDLELGGRTDGRDLVALQNIRSMLANLVAAVPLTA